MGWLATRAQLRQGLWKRQSKEAMFGVLFREREDAGGNQARGFAGIICLSSLLFRQEKKKSLTVVINEIRARGQLKSKHLEEAWI